MWCMADNVQIKLDKLALLCPAMEQYQQHGPVTRVHQMDVSN